MAKTECGVNDPVYFEMTVYSPGMHYITVNQESKMRYPKSAGYKYSDVHLIVGKVLQNGNYEFMASTC